MRLILSRLIIVCLAVALVSQSAVFSQEDDQKDAAARKLTVARIVINGSYPEQTPDTSPFGGGSETLSQILGRLEKARADKKIQAVVLNLKSPLINWGKVNEIRTAIGKIRKAKKKVIAQLDSANAMNYLIASACDEIIMPESGIWMVLGLRAEVGFYKNLFDKLDIKADILRVGEYKSAAEPFTRTSMSPAFREEMNEMLDDFYGLVIDSIAEARGLEKEQVLAAIDSAPHTPAKAKELGLIDHVAYPDEQTKLLQQEGSKVEVVYESEYGKKKIDTDFSGLTGMVKMMNLMMGVEPHRRPTKTDKIAIIHATGMIMPGKSASGFMLGDILGSDTIVAAVKKANEEKTVKAIVLRIDSPGGSSLASDLMWRALQTCGKPVVISMGDTAASGGYYIAMGGDYVFAEPGTLTGSIGVVGGKISTEGLYEKIGITTEVLSRGKNSGINSSTAAFSDSERTAMQNMLNAVYKQFVTRCAEARKMKYEELEKLARGRVYSGKKAVELKLVDELGTLDDAIQKAKSLANIPLDQKVEKMLLPKPTNPFEALFGSMETSLQTGQGNPIHNQSEMLKLMGTLSPEAISHLRAVTIVNHLLKKESVLTILPFRLSIR